MPTTTRSHFQRYGAAVASVALATLARWLLDPALGDHLPFVTYFAAVLFAAWYGGFGPSLLSVALGGAAATYFFMPPRGSLVLPELQHQVGVGAFLVVGIACALFSEAVQATRRRAEASAEEAARSREALNASEARYRQIVETAHEGVWVIDAEDRTTFANRRMAEILGCTVDDLLGRSAFDFVFPEDQPEGRRMVQQRRQGVREDLDFRYRRADGTEVWLRASASPLFDGGRYVGSMGLFTDISERRRAELEVRQQREWLEVTLASVDDAVIATDTEGRVTYLNPVARTLTGWTRQEAERQPLAAVFNIVNERTRQPVESPVVKALREGTVVGLANHTVLISRDGAERPIDDSAAPIRDARGQVVGVVLIFRDVTERRRAGLAHRRLAAIVESSDDAIVGKTLDGVITSWNAGAERVYGYPTSEVLGKPFSILVPPERDAEVRDSARRLHQGERLDHFETVRRRRDGTLIDVSVSYSPIKDDAGQVVGTAVITRDITSQKRAEEAARERERQLELVTENAPVNLAHCDAGRRFKFVNKPYAARFGLQPRDLVGKGFAEVLGAEAAAVIDPHVQAVLSGRRVEFEAEIPYKDLGTLHMQCAFQPEFGPDGRVVGYVAAVLDVTERKQVERALREAEARFAAVVNHTPACVFAKDRQGR